MELGRELFVPHSTASGVVLPGRSVFGKSEIKQEELGE
jgi:hypothetical protein